MNFSTAETPSGFMAACAERPGTVRRKVSAPDCTGQISRQVGSSRMAASAVNPFRMVASVPTPPDSSPVTLSTSTSAAGLKPMRCRTSTAKMAAHSPAFISQAPRPYSRPSCTAPLHGKSLHKARSPGGTTSTCPFRIREWPGARPYPRQRPITLTRPSGEKPSSPKAG